MYCVSWQYSSKTPCFCCSVASAPVSLLFPHSHTWFVETVLSFILPFWSIKERVCPLSHLFLDFFLLYSALLALIDPPESFYPSVFQHDLKQKVFIRGSPVSPLTRIRHYGEAAILCCLIRVPFSTVLAIVRYHGSNLSLTKCNS